MIGQQTIRQHAQRHRPARVVHDPLERRVVAVPAKDAGPTVATVDHVVAEPAHRSPCGSRHQFRLAEQT